MNACEHIISCERSEQYSISSEAAYIVRRAQRALFLYEGSIYCKVSNAYSLSERSLLVND